MSKEHLIPLGQKGNEEYDKKVRSKLKGSGSDKRKLAQRIAGLRKANPENIPDKIRRLVTDPKLSAYEIMLLIDFIKTEGLKKGIKPLELIQLGNLMVKAYTALHGQKTQNLNVNVDLTQEQINEKVYELLDNARNKIIRRKREGDRKIN